MSGCMNFKPADKPLEIFSMPHLAAMLFIALFCIILIFIKNKFKSEATKKYFRYCFAVLIFIQQAFLYIWYAYSGDWSVSVTLPLQLCDLSIFLSIAVLLSKNRHITELLYFWGLGGATQAILTPDIGNYTFPHFMFYQFFISHGFIILTCLYMVLVEKFRPTFRSVWRVFAITNIYAVIIIPVNLITGGNYLFLRSKPAGGSLLDFLGPWPWYVISLEAVAAAMFLLLYLPFAFGRAPSKEGQLTM